MKGLIQIEEGDRRLVAGIGETMAGVVRRSGEWVVCEVGCTECCLGPFEITALDAWRLRRGLSALPVEVSARVRARAEAYLGMEGDGDREDEPCPALDVETGRCEMYEARPVTCRVFGPATFAAEGAAVAAIAVVACELCYEGATPEEMAALAAEVDGAGLEGELVEALAALGQGGETTVARALLG